MLLQALHQLSGSDLLYGYVVAIVVAASWYMYVRLTA